MEGARSGNVEGSASGSSSGRIGEHDDVRGRPTMEVPHQQPTIVDTGIDGVYDSAHPDHGRGENGIAADVSSDVDHRHAGSEGLSERSQGQRLEVRVEIEERPWDVEVARGQVGRCALIHPEILEQRVDEPVARETALGEEPHRKT